MKTKEDWALQPVVDEACDAIIAEGQTTLDTINAGQVAKRLGCSANPSVYAKFRDWRARRRAEASAGNATVDVPPEVEAAIRGIFSRLSEDGVSACLSAVRTIGTSVDRAAQLHIAAADRRVEAAEAEVDTVLALGQQAETDLRAALIRIEELEQAVSDAQRREDRLAGRLEQVEASLAEALRYRSLRNPLAEGMGDGGSDGVDPISESALGHAASANDSDNASPANSAPQARLPLSFPDVDLGSLDADGGDHG